MNKKGEGQMQWIISLITIGLFTIAIISYVTLFASDNNSAIDISDDTQVSGLLVTTTSNVSSFTPEAESTYASIINSTIAPGSITTTGSGQYAITSTSAIGTSKNIIQVGYQKIFGSGNGFGLFMTALLGIIGTVTILYVIKLWRAGIPD